MLGRKTCPFALRLVTQIALERPLKECGTLGNPWHFVIKDQCRGPVDAFDRFHRVAAGMRRASCAAVALAPGLGIVDAPPIAHALGIHGPGRQGPVAFELIRGRDDGDGEVLEIRARDAIVSIADGDARKYGKTRLIQHPVAGNIGACVIAHQPNMPRDIDGDLGGPHFGGINDRGAGPCRRERFVIGNAAVFNHDDDRVAVGLGSCTNPPRAFGNQTDAGMACIQKIGRAQYVHRAALHVVGIGGDLRGHLASRELPKQVSIIAGGFSEQGGGGTVGDHCHGRAGNFLCTQFIVTGQCFERKSSQVKRSISVFQQMHFRLAPVPDRYGAPMIEAVPFSRRTAISTTGAVRWQVGMRIAL